RQQVPGALDVPDDVRRLPLDGRVEARDAQADRARDAGDGAKRARRRDDAGQAPARRAARPPPHRAARRSGAAGAYAPADADAGSGRDHPLEPAPLRRIEGIAIDDEAPEARQRARCGVGEVAGNLRHTRARDVLLARAPPAPAGSRSHPGHRPSAGIAPGTLAAPKLTPVPT